MLDTVCVYGHGLGGVGGVGGHENKVGGAAEFAILVESAGDRSASDGHGMCVLNMGLGELVELGDMKTKWEGLRNSRSTSSVFSTSINETSLSNSSINNTGVAVGTCRVVELGTLLRSYFCLAFRSLHPFLSCPPTPPTPPALYSKQ